MLSFNLINGRIAGLIFMVISFVIFVWSIYESERKEQPFGSMRTIEAVEQIDEAVRRAAEMGSHVSVSTGQGDIQGGYAMETYAAISLTGRIAETCAELGVPMAVMCSQALAYQVTVSTVRESYIKMGKEDEFREEYVVFVSPDWNAWAQAIMQHIMQTRPAANFMFGQYMPQGLLISETGVRAGSLQIAGSPTNPYIWALTCDFFTIGEELYAASAASSGDPVLIGSIAAQDIMKAILFVVIILGIVAGFMSNGIVTRFLTM